MTRFVEGRDRDQATLFPARLDEALGEDHPVRVVDAFIDALDLKALDFNVQPEATGRPGYPPATMLKIYLYGYLNQIQSLRRLERECVRNVELMWLTGQLTPDFKTRGSSVSVMACSVVSGENTMAVPPSVMNWAASVAPRHRD